MSGVGFANECTESGMTVISSVSFMRFERGERVFADPNSYLYSSSLHHSYRINTKQTLRYHTGFGQILFDGLIRARTLLRSLQ
jgi:hypothetical protein